MGKIIRGQEPTWGYGDGYGDGYGYGYSDGYGYGYGYGDVTVLFDFADFLQKKLFSEDLQEGAKVLLQIMGFKTIKEFLFWQEQKRISFDRVEGEHVATLLKILKARTE